jgi:hypothetical protein
VCVCVCGTVPGGADGPSGVLVCSEDYIVWRHQGHAEVRAPVPRRASPLDDGRRGLLLVGYAVHRNKVPCPTHMQGELERVRERERKCV